MKVRSMRAQTRGGWMLGALLLLLPGLRSEEEPDAQARREEAFAKKMSGVVLDGYFTMTGQAMDKPLPRDRYTLTRVAKISGDLWRFDARVQYGEHDVTVPIPLSVHWAGDTPVISLTDMQIPGLGTYTARVLIYRDHYAGFWSGGDHGGHLFGDIVPATADPPPAASPAPEKEKKDGQQVRQWQNWPSFRGPRASGVATGHETVASFDVATGRNVAFQTPLPGLAHSSPVLWGNKLFVTSAVPVDAKEAELTVGLYGAIAPVEGEGEQDLKLYCIDREKGEVLWERTAIRALPKVKRHTKGSHAASSPCTDGKHVLAFFASEGLYCYDMEGDLLWSKDFGLLDSGYYMVPSAQWGFASSPVIHEDLVLVQCDIQEGSFLTALDVETGEEYWRTPREEVPTWGSPTAYVTDSRAQVIVNGYHHIGAYDLYSGEEIWKLKGGGDIPVPTPIVAHDLIFITNAHGNMAPIYAIFAEASGELDIDPAKCDDMEWSSPRLGNYMQTPIVVGDLLYLCNDSGILTCFDARDGTQIYRQRLGDGTTGFTASPVAADGKLYYSSEYGEVHVVKAGPEFELLGVSELGEICMATPAIGNGVIYFRTRSHVIAVGPSGGAASGS